MTTPPQAPTISELLSEAVAALRELAERARDAHDYSFDDDYTVDTWQSDDLSEAIRAADAVVAKAEAVIGKPGDSTG